MTPLDIDTAVRAAGLKWSVAQNGGASVASLAPTEWCNVDACRSGMAVTLESGSTPSAYAAALVLAAGDPTTDPVTAKNETSLRALMATKKSMRAALAAEGLNWDCNGGSKPDAFITVWDVRDRAAAEVATAVSARDFYLASAAFEADHAFMAAALRDLVGDPFADPTVTPDSSTFDAIMEALP